MRGPKLLKYINSLTNPYRISIIFTFHSNSSNVRSMVAGRGVCQMITLDHKGGGGFWRGPKSDHTILEEPLQMFPFSASSILVQNLAESSWYKIGESRVDPLLILLSLPEKNMVIVLQRMSALIRPPPMEPSATHLLSWKQFLPISDWLSLFSINQSLYSLLLHCTGCPLGCFLKIETAQKPSPKF